MPSLGDDTDFLKSLEHNECLSPKTETIEKDGNLMVAIMARGYKPADDQAQEAQHDILTNVEARFLTNHEVLRRVSSVLEAKIGPRPSVGEAPRGVELPYHNPGAVSIVFRILHGEKPPKWKDGLTVPVLYAVTTFSALYKLTPSLQLTIMKTLDKKLAETQVELSKCQEEHFKTRSEELKLDLCSRCAALDLRIEKFLIDSNPFNEATHRWDYANADRMKTHGSSHFTLKTGISPQEFADVNELRAKGKQCQFCKLASTAIARYSRGNIPGNTKCFLTWQVDGRGDDTVRKRPRGGDTARRIINKTRRLRLSWGEDVNKGQVYLVLAAPNNAPSIGIEAPAPWGMDTQSLGREFHDDIEKQALIKSWLDLCHNEHGDTCSETHGKSVDHLNLVRESYFGVIDVVDMQLKSLPIENGTPARYVALSYVWGSDRKEPRYMTTITTVMTHIRHGGLSYAWAKLPKTIQDAILLWTACRKATSASYAANS
ncbi:hypothetical protein SLS62_006949 [Diatrype stigma]|uniref:Heterokaryon incompatibility domain-containing protein n=1 Tax=Diatrype stigma TaxID=117547 RepID=A0AAN9URS3_9PEZI